MKLADIKKVDKSKLPNKDWKDLYDEIYNGTDGFSNDYLELYETEIKEFYELVKKNLPDAIKEKVVKKREPKPKKPVIEFDADDVVEQVMADYNLTKEKAQNLIELRKEAYELKKENIEKLLDRLDKSEFYQGKNYISKAPIDKGRGRDIAKDSKTGSITEAEERKMSGTKFKRISKAGRKNQYGTTEGGKVYYEYRMNRRDVDNSIKLAKGGGVGMKKYLVTLSNPTNPTKAFKSFFVMADNYQSAKEMAITEARTKYGFWLQTGYTNVKVEESVYAKGGGVNIPNADKMFHLPYELAIYVPSTKDVDKNITSAELRSRVKEVEKYLAETFGGFTSAEKVGGYLSSKSAVVTEKVIPVTAFATMESFRANKSKLINKMSVWAKMWGQEAIGFEFEGDLYYVPQKFKTGGKLKATYIPKRDIKTLTTIWGNNIKGKDLIDGAYTTRKDLKTEPKVARTQFEEETFEFAKGGKTKKPQVVRYYFEDEAYEYAEGGILEHGLQLYDRIIDYDNKTDSIMVENNGINYIVHLPTGKRRTSFKVSIADINE